MAAAIVLGGGGSPAPGTEALLQLLCALAMLAWIWAPAAPGATPQRTDRTAWAIVALVLALPMLQLVPLPPSLWSAAPGQESRAAALALVGRADDWQPLSHSPPRTLAALLAMIPALFAFIATASLDARGRFAVVAAVAALVLASAVLGALQVSLGAAAGPYLYASGHQPYLTGFQANRNAQADVLLIGAAAVTFCLLPSLAGREERQAAPLLASRRSAGVLLGGFLVLLFSAVVLTGSRTGIALIAPALLVLWLMLRPVTAGLGAVRLLPLAGAALVLAVIGGVAWQGSHGALGRVAERFDFEGDFRTELWRDTSFAIADSWPVGVGLGGFEPAMLAAERLEVLDATRPNRAHNDYLELALEGGLPALLLLCAIVGLIGWRALHFWRRAPAQRPQLILGGSILFIIGIHSLVDYPLRSMALSCLTGTGAGLLMGLPRGAPVSGRPGRSVPGGGLA